MFLVHRNPEQVFHHTEGTVLLFSYMAGVSKSQKHRWTAN